MFLGEMLSHIGQQKELFLLQLICFDKIYRRAKKYPQNSCKANYAYSGNTQNWLSCEGLPNGLSVPFRIQNKMAAAKLSDGYLSLSSI